MRVPGAVARAPWSAEKDQILSWIWPAATFLVALALTLGVRHLLFRWIRKRFKGNSFAAVFLETLGMASVLWCLAAALDISLHFTPTLTGDQVTFANKAIGVFVIVSLTLVAASLAVRLVAAYGERQGMPFAVAGLSRTLVRILVVALGLMPLLNLLGITIAPIITALGVTGLAVALALQDTLANFFAGIHILVERPIFVGDLIRLENGQEGVVTDIGWRTTRVRNGSNDMVVVPNTKITSGILINSSLPSPRTQAEIALLVAHEADPERVRAIALEESAATDGVLKDPPPAFLCDPGVLPTHVQFKVCVSVDSRQRQAAVQSELRMRILRRFREEGVPMPVVADGLRTPMAGML